MSEQPTPAQLHEPDAKGWQKVAEEMREWHPDLREHAKRNLEQRGIEISPEHHQSHIDIARPAVSDIYSLPPKEQDYIGEIIELGEEALEDAGINTMHTTDALEAKNEFTSNADKIKQNLESYFSSDTIARHIETASKGDFERKSDFIGDVVQYNVLFPDATPDQINKYAYAQSINYLSNPNSYSQREVQKADYIVSEVAQVLGIASDKIEAHKEDIAQYVYDKYVTNGFVFHGFNSAAEASIKQYGLSGEKREWDNNDIGEINAVFAKYGVENIAGWHELNSEGAYFVSDTPTASYSYAARSPEWFSSFAGGSLNYASIREDDGRAFSRRDRAAARHSIESLMAKVNMDTSDQQYVLAFFDRHWNMLAEGTKPKLALVERRTIDEQSRDFTATYEAISTTWDGRPQSVAETIQDLLAQYDSNDRQIRKTASPEAITIIELPR
ncbi:MAG: hypothetical protein QG649_464 [Patescibacteria group bacterium]|nr:hypothetical protein [Patescibacteria group bacterium]